MTDVWPIVHAERARLIDFLATLDEDRWDTPSLCAEWSVHDVLAHLLATAKTTRSSFVAGLAAARFHFHRFTARGVTRERGRTPAETLDRFRAVAHRTSTPPAPADSRLVEAIVHAEDIRRPLGAGGSYPAEAVTRALRLQLRTPATFGGGKERAAGVRLLAEDTGESFGDGPEVRGPALSLLLGVCGRGAPELHGPGLASW